MKINSIMTRNVHSVPPATPIAKAAEKMREFDIGFLPVYEDGELRGAVTDRDITIRSVAQGRDPRLAPVSEVMSPECFFCYDDEDVERVAEYMRQRQVRRIVVLDRQQALAGVVSLGDIAKMSGEQKLAGETLGEIAEAA